VLCRDLPEKANVRSPRPCQSLRNSILMANS
jgi:hypothetical protein